MSESGPRSADPRNSWFETTHWSVVFLAKDAEAPGAAEALETLCQSYWPPIFTFLRRSGYGIADAEDLTQMFFARMLERGHLARLRHREGRFRSFLLTFLKHFVLEERSRAAAQKRGGDRTFVSLDAFTEEERRAWEPAETLTPEKAFDRRWAELILERAVTRLGDEYRANGRSALFEALKNVHLGHKSIEGYAALGASLGLSEAAVKSAVQRLRLRHRELLREEIAQTVAGRETFQEEIRHFMDVLR